jgi:hypothetical protein
LVLYPEIDAGITVQSNNAGFDSGLAFRFAEAFFGDALRVKPVASTTGYDPATFVTAAFDDYVGRYALDAAPAFILTFSRTGDSLFTQATGQQRVRIYPTSDSTFELRVVKASVTFHRDSSGKVNAATLHQNGNQRATRLPGDAEKAWLPTVGELLEFAGRYYSEELETFHALVLEDSVLTLKQPRVEPVKMVSGADDTFTAGGLTLSFERDRNDRVLCIERPDQERAVRATTVMRHRVICGTARGRVFITYPAPLLSFSLSLFLSFSLFHPSVGTTTILRAVMSRRV